MNDRDLDIFARNAIMLLVTVIIEDVDVAAERMMHILYSSLIRKSDFDNLQGRVRPLIEGVCERIREKAGDSILGKTWIFGQRSLRLVLQKASWDRLLSFLYVHMCRWA